VKGPPGEPGREDVLTVESRVDESGERRFGLVDAGADPELAGLVEEARHESELVEALRERGWRLTMVGGGASSDEVRRFYFRRSDGEDA